MEKKQDLPTNTFNKYRQGKNYLYFGLETPHYLTRGQVYVANSTPTNYGWCCRLDSKTLADGLAQIEKGLLQSFQMITPKQLPQTSKCELVQTCLSHARKRLELPFQDLENIWSSNVNKSSVDAYFNNPRELGMCLPLNNQPRCFTVTLTIHGIWLKNQAIGPIITLSKISPEVDKVWS